MLIIKISRPAALKHTYNNTSALHTCKLTPVDIACTCNAYIKA